MKGKVEILNIQKKYIISFFQSKAVLKIRGRLNARWKTWRQISRKKGKSLTILS